MGQPAKLALTRAIPDQDVWLDVAVGESLDEAWPPHDADPTAMVSAVDAKSYSNVTADLQGLRGHFDWRELFPPTIEIGHHPDLVADPPLDFLHSYRAASDAYQIIRYRITYAHGQTRTLIVRVWQNADFGRDWIVRRIAYEQARDVYLSSKTPPCPPPLV